jgi:hypothetical protein
MIIGAALTPRGVRSFTDTSVCAAYVRCGFGLSAIIRRIKKKLREHSPVLTELMNNTPLPHSRAKVASLVQTHHSAKHGSGTK